MPRIIPMKDLRNTNEIMDMCKESNDRFSLQKTDTVNLLL